VSDEALEVFNARSVALVHGVACVPLTKKRADPARALFRNGRGSSRACLWLVGPGREQSPNGPLQDVQ
jgi:hypothetical protein